MRPPAAARIHQLPRVLVYLAVFALAVLGWGFTAMNATFPDEPLQSIVQVAVKLVTMVVVPAWLFLGFRLDARATLSSRRLLLVFVVMSLAYLAMQAVFGRGLITLRELSPPASTLAWAIPLCWLWQTLEAGLCEEVLFRRVLQEKIALASGSQVAAVAWASLLFGLAHAPGLWLRGGHLMEGVAACDTGVGHRLFHRHDRAGRHCLRRIVGAHAVAVADRAPARHGRPAAATRAVHSRMDRRLSPASNSPLGDAAATRRPMSRRWRKPSCAYNCFGPRVLVAHVQERGAAASERVIGEHRRQPARVATAVEVGMRADRTHLRVRIGAYALTDDRGQPALLVDAEIAAHLHRPRTEVMRIHQRGQGQHIVPMRVGQFDDLRPLDHLERRGADHLRQGPERFQVPAFRHDRRDSQQVHALAGSDQRRHGVRDIHAGMRDAQERCELGRVTGRLALGQGDATMPRAQGNARRDCRGRGRSFAIPAAQGLSAAAAMFVRPPGRWQHAGREPRPGITVVPRFHIHICATGVAARRPPSSS
jgi:membrane protease YdiL (CAAX protease family)